MAESNRRRLSGNKLESVLKLCSKNNVKHIEIKDDNIVIDFFEQPAKWSTITRAKSVEEKIQEESDDLDLLKFLDPVKYEEQLAFKE